MLSSVFSLWLACGGKPVVADSDGDIGQLTEDSFDEQYAERFCEELLACNTSAVCQAEDVDQLGDTGCEFDDLVAETCLQEAWTCHTENGLGLAYVVPPQTCLEVYTCGATTTL